MRPAVVGEAGGVNKTAFDICVPGTLKFEKQAESPQLLMLVSRAAYAVRLCYTWPNYMMITCGTQM